MSGMPSRMRAALAVGAAALAMLIYAGQFVFSRWSMTRTLSLWDLAALRFMVAGLLSVAIVVRHPPAGARSWRRIAVLSIGAGAPYTLVMYAGLTLAPASHGAVIITGATPVFAAMLAWLWLGERQAASKSLGLALIVIGLILVGWPELRGGGSAWLGDVLFTVAAVLWAVFTVAVHNWRIAPLPATAAVWVLALPYLPAYVLVAHGRLLDAPRGEVVFQGLFQGLGVAIIALALYAWAIRVLGDGRAALFMPLVPVFAVLLGVAVLGEVPAAVQVLGIVGVTLGMALAAAGREARSQRVRPRSQHV
jgi:drug/metabolite transporter (DMT)-like permease